MIKQSKNRLLDESGGVVKAITLYKLFITMKNLDGTYKIDDDGKPLKSIALDGYVLGNGKDAIKAAKEKTAEIAPHYPECTVQITYEAMEMVGPLIQQQLFGAMKNINVQNLVAFTLAAELAEYKIKENLDLNPNREAITHQLVIEASQIVQKKMQEVQAQHNLEAAGGPSGLVTTNGAPLTAENAGGTNQSLCTGTGEPCCGKEDCSDSCAEPESFDGEDSQLDEQLMEILDGEVKTVVVNEGEQAEPVRDHPGIFIPATLGYGTVVEDCEYRVGRDQDGAELGFGVLNEGQPVFVARNKHIEAVGVSA